MNKFFVILELGDGKCKALMGVRCRNSNCESC